MPGNEKKLTKARIKSASGEGSVDIECYFNPKEWQFTKPVNWKEHPFTGGNVPAQEFTAGAPRQMTVELLFDLFEERGNVFEKYIEPLMTLTLIDESKGRPPMVEWVSGSIVFKGVVKQLQTTYTMFNEDLTPTRAKVNLQITEAEKAMTKEEAKEFDKKQKELDEKNAKPGDRPAPGDRKDQDVDSTGAVT